MPATNNVLITKPEVLFFKVTMKEKSTIRYILFDAANTLIHKPTLWPAIISVLKKYGYDICEEKLQLNHKLLSEYFHFPDRTSETFYSQFNTDLLLSLGIIPTDELLKDLFSQCSYLPWSKFNDTAWLNSVDIKLGVISNFNNNLNLLLNNLFGDVFSDIIVSEIVALRKPSPEFYRHALQQIDESAEHILYIGDSLKLDMLPAGNLGMQVRLIDRINAYSAYPYAISSLEVIPTLISAQKELTI